MKCLNCGSEIPEGANFCDQCGFKIEQPVNSEPVALETPLNAQETFNNTEALNEEETSPIQETPVTNNPATQQNVNNIEIPPKKSKKTLWITAIIIATVLIAGLITALTVKSFMPISDEKARTLIDEAYEKLKDSDYDSAEKILKKIHLKDDSQYTEILDELLEIAEIKPKVSSVNTDNYPRIDIVLETDSSEVTYTKDNFKITNDNYSDLSIDKLEKSGEKYTLSYTTEVSEDGQDINDNLVFTKYQNIDFSLPVKYVSKRISYADISYVTSNVEAYPEVSLYVRVVDEYGNPVENLNDKSFVIREYLNINDYLERDVIYAAKIDGNDALNVSLAIDRSASISDTDMTKIKNATNTFLSKLQFGSGDKAEIVSFDTNVMQMCLFTNNKDNLMNGVNSMFPYGMTACYDAIVRSIQNASTQSGARCVIVFTDGLDNESVHNVNSVIQLAKEKSVPVYTIGVGSSLDVSALKRIAESTGGTYHHIDDVSAMSRIYEEIYREQKNLYHVKYISDNSLAENAERKIIINISGNGYVGECETVYTPVVPVKTEAHSSRYEVIKADISWEDANRECINKGGHLATITSYDEEQKIIAVAESSGIERLWIGGYTTNDENGDAVGHWVMGEPFVYQNWYSADEPSRFDSDNAAEFYLMLWKINGRWSWNDQRNDLINSQFSATYKGKMGYVIEYEE